LNIFLRFSRALTEDEKEIFERDPANFSEYVKDKKPVLADFKREIDYFMNLYKQCDKFENEKIFLRWLLLNIRPFKQIVLNTICKWTNLFKTYLVNNVNKQ